MMLIAHI